jgi:twitching motility protein PilU
MRRATCWPRWCRPNRIEELEGTGELNMGVPLGGRGQLSLSAMRQRGSYAAVIRFISQNIPSLDTLNPAPILADLIMEKRGLILMVGATGAGKSTTLASMIDTATSQHDGPHPDHRRPGGIPVQETSKSVVNQREVGSDTESLQIAPEERAAPGARRDPDRRNPRPRNHVGRHCLRAVGPPVPGHHARQQQLPGAQPHPELLPGGGAPHHAGRPGCSALKAIVSQRLLRTVDGGRVPAVEVMLNTKLVGELIEKGDFSGVKEAMEKSMAEGSQTFEQTSPA